MAERVHLRAFFALPVPQHGIDALREARKAIERRSQASGLGLRCLGDESLHVTLCFLGRVALEKLTAFHSVLALCKGVPFLESRWTALGAFPSSRDARVIVAELQDSGARIGALSRAIALACEPLGVPREKRPFRPHVTLARATNPSNVRDYLESPKLPASRIVFREVRLYASELSPAGSRYTVLGHSELADQERGP